MPPTLPHARAAGRHQPIRKISFIFQAAACAQPAPAGPRHRPPPRAPRRRPHTGPFQSSPGARGPPSPALSRVGILGHGSVLLPRCRLRGRCRCCPSLRPRARLPPPRVGSSLPPRSGLWGWRARAPAGSAAVSGGCCRTPAHLRDTRRGVTPRTFRQLPPTSLRPPCGERRRELQTLGGSLCQPWGAPLLPTAAPCRLHEGRTAPKWPVPPSWGSSALPRMDRQIGLCPASGWVGGCGVAAERVPPTALSPCREMAPMAAQCHHAQTCGLSWCHLGADPQPWTDPQPLDRPMALQGMKRLSPNSQHNFSPVLPSITQHGSAEPSTAPTTQPSTTQHGPAQPSSSPAQFQPSPTHFQPNTAQHGPVEPISSLFPAQYSPFPAQPQSWEVQSWVPAQLLPLSPGSWVP